MKNNQIHKWIKYYRNSLADGELLDVKTKDCEDGKFYNSFHDLNPQNLSELYRDFTKSEKGKKQQAISETSDEEKFPLNVFIAPFSLNKELSHTKKSDNIQKVFPFWIPATINEKGEINSPDENKIPWFVRSVLEPVFSDSNYFPIISSIKDIDKVLDSHIFNFANWDDYWNSSENFFKAVTGTNYSSFKLDDFVTIKTICIIKAKEIVTAQNIMRVYDDLKNTNTIPPLVSNLLSFQNQSRKQLPDNKQLFLSKGHYGQYNNQFPLSSSQRTSLLIFESESKGNILAVNGPPGTGKTTLLQSVVANEVVKAVINGNTPPKIIASSTNNQAITNILDSFGSTNDNFERWLPKVSSLGSYLISSDTKKQNEAINKGYKIITRSNDDLDGQYFSDFHNADIIDLEKHFTTCFLHSKTMTNNISVQQIIETLKSNIKNTTAKIDNVLNIIHSVNVAEQEHFPLTKLPQFLDSIEKLKKDLAFLIKDKEEHLKFRNNYNQFVEKNKLSIFLSFIPSIKQSYHRKLALFLVDSLPDFKNLTTNKEVESSLIVIIQALEKQIVNIKTELDRSQTIYNSLIKLKADIDNLTSELSILWEKYLDCRSTKEREQIETEFQNIEFVEKANRILDISYRYDAFIDSVHYWEGLWVLKQKTDELKINKGLTSRENIFTRISYLTPLFISTFHSVPAFCSYFEKTSDNWIQKPIYKLFDLLIVDEAGQVAPEIGIPTFSLANKALVVGDIFQIEPVWNICYEKIDKGNLKEIQLLKEYDFKQLKDWGVLCSSGSLMHLAQKASTYEINSNIGGTLLTEHRRCVDELVAFSNKYIYDNMLKPMVGSSNGNHFSDGTNELYLPSLGYLNIRGISEKRSGSIYNTIEATSIAQWIKKYGKLILDHYNKGKLLDEKKSIKDCIAVITPFSEQKNEIYRQFSAKKIDTDITVGTVHALQGAERPIVIFSPAYGMNQTDSQLFFDSGYNMLNVALTRAKKHFIVMGNMNLFNPKNDQKPSGGLAHYLFADNLNELSSSIFFDEKALKSENRVDSLERHQQCLKRAFKIAKKRIVIVSPFISISAIHSDNLLPEIQNAVSNNVEVHIYTDKYLDMPNNKIKKHSEEGREALIKAGAKMFILNGIHNKAIAIDENVLIEGSFNWLSASRDKNNSYYRHEVSQIIKDKEATMQIAQLLQELSLISN